jgi:glycosyltransferase involved in cell wall biosynthesis
MKIVYIVNTRMPNQRAHGFQIAKTCEKFAAMGNDVLLLHPYRKNDLTQDIFDYYGLQRNFKAETIFSIDVIVLSRLIGFLAFYLQSLLFSLALLFRKFDKDSVIYTRDIFIVFLFQIKGHKVVYNVHNWSKKRELFSKLLNKNIKIVSNSEGTKRKMMEEGFTHVIAVPNGVDIGEYNTVADVSETRKKLNLPIDKKIAMYVGNLYQWKGIDVILEASRLMKEARVLFVIVGGDTDDLKKYSEKVVGVSNVLFVGHKRREDVPLYVRSADVLLLPNSAVTEESRSQTSPIKMFEYMASSVPIIASSLPSIQEVLNSDSALLIEPDSPVALAQGIEEVLNNQSLAKKKAEKALADVKKYTWDEYAKKIIQFIES